MPHVPEPLTSFGPFDKDERYIDQQKWSPYRPDDDDDDFYSRGDLRVDIDDRKAMDHDLRYHHHQPIIKKPVVREIVKEIKEEPVKVVEKVVEKVVDERKERRREERKEERKEKRQAKGYHDGHGKAWHEAKRIREAMEGKDEEEKEKALTAEEAFMKGVR